jgi:hypothetical protein
MFLLFVLYVNAALAHTPLRPDDNESLETATVIPDPTKSWAIYAELHEEGEAQYYRLDLKQGERFRAMLFIPIEENGFLPNLVIMGSGIQSQDAVPPYVEVPDEAGIKLVEANGSVGPAYEPFTPSSYYYLADFDLEVPVDGAYYVAVYESSRGGHYGLAIGYREEYTLDEWILVPIDVIGIHQWEGQSLGFILAPLVATLVIGFLVLIWRKKNLYRSFRTWMGTLAGLLYLGTGVMMLTQMFIALTTAALELSVLVTVVFAMLPILLGFGVLRLTVRSDETVTIRVRALLALLGILGIFAWAGLLIGPSLVFLTSILPGSETTRRTS